MCAPSVPFGAHFFRSSSSRNRKRLWNAIKLFEWSPCNTHSNMNLLLLIYVTATSDKRHQLHLCELWTNVHHLIPARIFAKTHRWCWAILMRKLQQFVTTFYSHHRITSAFILIHKNRIPTPNGDRWECRVGQCILGRRTPELGDDVNKDGEGRKTTFRNVVINFVQVPTHLWPMLDYVFTTWWLNGYELISVAAHIGLWSMVDKTV